MKPSDKVFPNPTVSSSFREFFHDYRLNDEFIIDKLAYKDLILTVGESPTKTNTIFTWYYQDFNIPKGTGNKGKAPSQKQIENVRKKLCKKPKDVLIKPRFTQ